MAAETAPPSNTGSTATQRRTAASQLANPSNSAAESPSSSAAIAAPSAILLKLPSKLLKILTILLRVSLWPLLKLINSILFPLKEYDGIYNGPAADRAARAFCAMMRSHISSVTVPPNAENNEQYVEPTCPFVERGYNATMSSIVSHRDTRPLLLIYLHSPLHRNADKFLREYLCYGPLLELLNSNSSNDTTNSSEEGSVICFGASVHSADGQRIREMLDVTSFPFMALLHVKSNSNNRNNNSSNNSYEMELLLRLEGEQILTLPPAQITAYLSASLTHHNQMLAEALASRLAREEEVRLRQEQDREYQEALLADQIREMERREEEERLKREEEETLESLRLKDQLEREKMDKAREIVERCGDEPPPGPGTARIRFTLPNGKKIDRRFRSVETTVEVLRAFLMVHFQENEMDGIKNIGLSTNFPRRTFGEEDDGLSLEEAGLSPQAVVMVQDLDA